MVYKVSQKNDIYCFQCVILAIALALCYKTPVFTVDFTIKRTLVGCRMTYVAASWQQSQLACADMRLRE